MKRASSWMWVGASLFLLAVFATPLHLTLEAHESHPEESGEEHRHDSDRETHLAVDHELTALAKAPRFVLPCVDIAMLPIEAAQAVAPMWVPPVESEATGPPDAALTPPSSPRAPPL